MEVNNEENISINIIKKDTAHKKITNYVVCTLKLTQEPYSYFIYLFVNVRFYFICSCLH